VLTGVDAHVVDVKGVLVEGERVHVRGVKLQP
jgi:hypothetical protein